MDLMLLDLLLLGGAAFLIRKKLLRRRMHWAIGLGVAVIVWWGVCVHLLVQDVLSSVTFAFLPSMTVYFILVSKCSPSGETESNSRTVDDA